jgi:predicted DsbA family dithiol-disulfide isomerase
MSELNEGAVCGADGCVLKTEPTKRFAHEPGKFRVVSVEIISDAICPWCFVGKRRFGKAVAKLPEGVTVAVRWLPFELNPQMPPGGMDRVAYRSRKFGSLEHSQQLDARIAAVGAQEGIDFRHDLIGRAPNTFNAHRLIWLAEQEGVQDAIVEAVFRAYFVEGRDIGDPAVLAELATSAGVARARVEGFLASDEGADAVIAAELGARRLEVSGVPTFMINGEPAFSGAQHTDLMLAHLLAAARG